MWPADGGGTDGLDVRWLTHRDRRAGPSHQDRKRRLTLGHDGERGANPAERGVGTIRGEDEPAEAPPAPQDSPPTARPAGPAGEADPYAPPFDPYAPPSKDKPRPGTPVRPHPPADSGRYRPEPAARRPEVGRPAGPPARPPAATRQTDPRGQRALGFALLGLVSAYLIPRIGAWMGVTGVPLLGYEIGGSAVGLVLDVVAIVLGIRYARQAAARQRRVPGAIGGAVLGALAALTAGYLLAQFAFLYPQLRDYYSCLSGANTQVATQACQSTFDKAVKDKTGGAETPTRFGPASLFSLTP
jgi:hypothetical protein